MPVVGVGEILVRPSFKDFQREVGAEVDQTVGKVGPKAGRTLGSRLAGAAKKAAKVGALAAGVAAGAAMVGGFKSGIDQQNSKKVLAGLYGSVKEAESMMKSLRKVSKNSPIDYSTYLKAAESLAYSGVEGEKATKTLENVGKAITAAGGTSEDMDRATDAVMKMVNAGKVSLDSLQQLSGSGVPIISGLAEHFGVSMEEINTMASKGKIGIEDVTSVMEKGTGKTFQTMIKAGEEASKSFGNQFKIAKDNVVAAIGSGMLPLLDRMAPAIGVLGDALANFIEKSSQGISGLYDLMAKGNFTTAFREAFGVEEDSKLVDFLLNVREGIKKVAGAAGGIATKLYEMRKPIGIIVGLITVSLIPHWVALGVEAIKSAKKQAMAWFIAKRDAIKGAFTHSWAVTTMVAGWVLLGVQAMAQAARIAAAWVVALGPVGWVIGAVIAVGAALVLAYKKVDWFRDAVDTAFQWVKDVAIIAFGGVRDAIGAVVAWFQNTVAPAFGTAANAVGGFFTDLWQKYVAPVWEGIKAAIGAVVTWFQNTVAPAFGTAVNAVGGFFTGLWQNYIVPAWEGIKAAIGAVITWFQTYVAPPLAAATKAIGAVFQWLYEKIVKPVWAVISFAIDAAANVALLAFDLMVFAVKKVLAPAFTWLYKNVIKPVWSAITKAIQVAWPLMKVIFVAINKVVKNTVGAVFTWLWKNIIKPVWGWIKGYISTQWLAIKAIFKAIKWVLQNVVAPAMKWIYNKVIKPVWGGIKTFISNTWGGIKRIFNAIRDFIKGPLAAVFRWLRDNLIKPVWNGIKSTISSVWHKGIKPVFQALGSFIKNKVAPAFKKGVEAIGKAWDGLKKVAAAPIRFIIDKVYTKGIAGTFNKIAKAIDSDAHLDPLSSKKILGFSRGGWTGPGTRLQEAGVVHADEFVIQKSSQRDLRKQAPGFLDSLNRFGAKALGYASGGLVRRPVGGRVTSGFGAGRGRYPHAGIDFAVPIGTAVRAALDGVVRKAQWNAVNGRSGKGMLLDHPGNRSTYYGHLSSWMAKVGDQVKQGQAIARSGNTGNSTGPHLHFETWSGGKPLNPARFLGGDVLPQGAEGGGGIGDWIGAQVAKLGNLKDWAANKISGAFPGAGQLLDAGKWAMKNVVAGLPKFMMSKLSGVMDTAGNLISRGKNALGFGNTKDQVRGVADGYGWAKGAQWRALSAIINKESGWDLNAANPNSNARGLFQKMTSIHGAVEKTAGDQAGWGLNYIKTNRNFNDPIGAWNFHKKNNWYADGGHVTPPATYLHDDGGWANPGLNSILNMSRKPEPVLNGRQWDTAHKAMQLATSRSGGDTIQITVPDRATARDFFQEAQFQKRVMSRGGAGR